MVGKGITKTDVSVEAAATTNFYVLAMATAATSIALPTVPRGLFSSFASPNPQNLTLNEIYLNTRDHK